MDVNWHDYLPTPKMLWTLVFGGVAWIAIALADLFDLADIRAAAAGLIVLLIAEVGGYIKEDESSPRTLRTRDDLSRSNGPDR